MKIHAFFFLNFFLKHRPNLLNFGAYLFGRSLAFIYGLTRRTRFLLTNEVLINALCMCCYVLCMCSRHLICMWVVIISHPDFSHSRLFPTPNISHPVYFIPGLFPHRTIPITEKFLPHGKFTKVFDDNFSFFLCWGGGAPINPQFL